jgi:hypothetical protein
MPMDYNKYAPDWKEISLRVRERDGNRCKWCGVLNGAVIRRLEDGESYVFYGLASELPKDFRETHPQGRFIVRVVLTVAHHPDPDPMNCSDDNLLALCQRCHNRLDMPMRQAHAKQTRARKRQEKITSAGQVALPIPLEDDTNGIDIQGCPVD